MIDLEVASTVRACRGGGQDRLATWRHEADLLVALADGAGGVGRGGAAAQAIVDGAQTWRPTSETAVGALEQLDRHLVATLGGQSTAILLCVSEVGIAGASVGDSGAWIVRGGSIEDLTETQSRKPLVGSGAAAAVAFRAGPLDGGTLLVASDGLLKYAARGDIARVAVRADLHAAVGDLVALVTLRSGDVPDDVAVLLCRERA